MRVVDNVFNKLELQYVHDQFNESLKKGWEVNKFLWQSNLVEGFDGFVLMQHVSDKLKTIVADAVTKHVKFKEQPNAMFYMWNEGSGINWHRDDHVEKACTIYLQDWPIERGGQFIYQDDKNDYMVPIIENRMVVNDNHTEHKVSRVRKCRDHIRYTLQVFGK